MKGEKARGKIRQGFEGGQMPLQRRLPKLKGFKPRNRVEYQLVNVEKLNLFADGEEVGPETMRERGLVKGDGSPVKVLGAGELEKKLSVRAHAFTAGARAKIEARGGSAEVV
jgi:large subunit ribosomal protein L15